MTLHPVKRDQSNPPRPRLERMTSSCLTRQRIKPDLRSAERTV